MRELLSIKGFFKAWCGKGRFSPEINLTMLGIDRDHPVVKGSSLDSTIVPRALLEHRAWKEVMQEFKRSNIPTAADIRRLFTAYGNLRQVATEMKIALATVYKILGRGRQRRRRYHFRSD